MAAETVIIDVVASFKDQMDPGMSNAKKKSDKFEESINKCKKQVDNLSKGKATVKMEAQDKATDKLKKGVQLAKEFGGKTWKSTMKIVDMATSPLRAIKNTLFSVKGLIAAVAGGMAANQLIAQPIALADQMETSFIGFETMFKSASKAQQMMDEINAFAAKTPFDTAGVVSSVQQMIRAGWSADSVMKDMEKIGNAAAAAGQGTEGVQGIVLALQQMRMAGKLNAQDMMQLTNRGVKAWEYVADAMGVTIPKAREMSEKGLIPVEKAIQGIIDGMSEYDGMMDKMSTRTVSGIMSNLKDTFDIKIVSKWGKGLAAGATVGLGSIASWLDEIDPMLQKAGTSLEELGEQLSSGFFDKIENAKDRLMEVIGTDEFKNADLFGKISIAWDKVIAEPFGEWWDGTGRPWIMKKISGFGEGMGAGASDLIKGLLGVDLSGAADDAATVGGSFARGFLEGFDGSGVLEALKDAISGAIKDALNILPFGNSASGSSWLSAALLGYGGLKIGGGLLSTFNSASGLLGGPTAGALFGKLGTATAAKLGAGSAMTTVGGHMTTAGLGAAATSAAGLGAIGGGVMAAGSLISGGKDIYRAVKANDDKEKGANAASATLKIGGVASGAAMGAGIGSVIPGIGTVIGGLIGAGIGGVSGWLGGEKVKKNYEQDVQEAEEKTRKLALSQEAAKYSSKEMQDAIKNTSMSLDEFKDSAEYAALMAKASGEDMKSHFGNISLSMEEISTLAKKITLGDNTKNMDKFSTAAENAEMSLNNLKSSMSALEKIQWKAGLGMELTSDEQQDYKTTIDEYISNAKSYVEDKHYEFTAAISLLMDVSEGTTGAGILEKGNTIFAGLQKQLDELGGNLTKQVDIALEDGKITADEQKIISDIQAKIQEITDKVSTAEAEAKMEALKIKFGGADMDSESFKKLQEELMAQVEETKLSYDKSLEVGIAGLKLQFPDGGAEYDAALKELTDSYNAKIEKLNVDVQGFQFDTLAETYGTELETALADMDLQGTTAEKIKQAMSNAVADGVDVTTWDKETAAKYLGLDSLKEESAQAITDITADIAKTIPGKLSEAFSSGETGTTVDAAPLANSVIGGMTTSFETADYSPVGTAIDTGVSNYLSTAESTVSGAPYAAALDTSIQAGITEDKFTGTGSKAVSSADGAVKSAFDGHSVSTSLDIKVTPKVSLTKSSATISASGSGGSGSGKISFSVIDNYNGGFVSGGPQLSWLDEERQGEVVIPLGSNRRSRGLELWEKTGEMLGVAKHANGGFVGRALSAAGKGKKQSPASDGEKKIEVNIGGVTIEVKAGEGNGNLLSMIKAQKNAIADEISEILANALSEAYENMPLSST